MAHITGIAPNLCDVRSQSYLVGVRTLNLNVICWLFEREFSTKKDILIEIIVEKKKSEEETYFMTMKTIEK